MYLYKFVSSPSRDFYRGRANAIGSAGYGNIPGAPASRVIGAHGHSGKQLEVLRFDDSDDDEYFSDNGGGLGDRSETMGSISSTGSGGDRAMPQEPLDPACLLVGQSVTQRLSDGGSPTAMDVDEFERDAQVIAAASQRYTNAMARLFQKESPGDAGHSYYEPFAI